MNRLFNKKKGDWVTVRLAEQVSIQQAAPQVTPEVTPEVTGMLLVMVGEMTRSEIMKKLGLKDEKHFRENYQQVAVNLGLIEMTIPDKPRSTKQRYRITALGRQILKQAGKEKGSGQ